MNKILNFLIFSIVIIPNLYANRSKKLTILTYKNFDMSMNGPGKKIKQLFEKYNNCHLIFKNTSNSGQLLSKLKSKNRPIKADIVLGLDRHDAITLIEMLPASPLQSIPYILIQLINF